MTELQELLSKAIDLGVEINQIATFCCRAPGSVNQWISGYSIPSKSMEKQLIRWLKRRIKYLDRISKNLDVMEKENK